MNYAIHLTIFALLAAWPLLGQEKPAAPSTAAPAADADSAWAQVESLLQGPTERATQENRKRVLTAHLQALDECLLAFQNQFPQDPRRWQGVLHMYQTQPLRETLGLKILSQEEQQQLLRSILDAPDAEPRLQGNASYMRVRRAQPGQLLAELTDHLKRFPKHPGNLNLVTSLPDEDKIKFVAQTKAQADAPEGVRSLASLCEVINARPDEAKFEALAQAHLKAFPDLKSNQEIEDLRLQIKANKEIKQKPLDLKFKALSGKDVDMAAMRGKVVLIDFWASWCKPCVQEMPRLVQLYHKHHGAGLEVIGISFDRAESRSEMEKLISELKIPWEHQYEGNGWNNSIGLKYNIKSIPRLWLVDKSGMVVDLNARDKLEEKVMELLGRP